MAQVVQIDKSIDKPIGPASQVAPAFRSAGIALAATALIAVCAHISLPLFFTPVPLTMQPFAVLLIGLLLSPGAAFTAAALYLLEGAAGLPVFTPHGLGGVAQLLGPTGGYLFSYLLVAPLVSWLARRGPLTFARAAWSAGLASLVTLALGAAWFAALTHTAPQATLAHAVWPFVPGDVLKVLAAAGVAVGIQKLRTRKDRAAAAH